MGKNLDSIADLTLSYSILITLLIISQINKLLIYPMIIATILLIIIVIILKSKQKIFEMPHLVSAKIMTILLFINIGLYLVNFKFKDILFLFTLLYIIFYVCIDYINYALNLKTKNL